MKRVIHKGLSVLQERTAQSELKTVDKRSGCFSAFFFEKATARLLRTLTIYSKHYPRLKEPG